MGFEVSFIEIRQWICYLSASFAEISDRKRDDLPENVGVHLIIATETDDLATNHLQQRFPLLPKKKEKEKTFIIIRSVSRADRLCKVRLKRIRPFGDHRALQKFRKMI